VTLDCRHGWLDAEAAGLLLYVIQQERAAGAKHVVGEPVTGRPRERFARLAFLVDQREMYPPFWLIGQREVEARRVKKLVDLPVDGFEQVVKLQVGVQRLADAAQH